MFSVKLFEQEVMEVPQGTTILDVASSCKQWSEHRFVAAKLEGQIVDLQTKVQGNCSIDLITVDSPDGVEIVRRSATFVLGHALSRLYKDDGIRFASSGATTEGFHYDVELDRPLSTNDLDKIQREMDLIVNEDMALSSQILQSDEATVLFLGNNEPYKAELLKEVPVHQPIFVYQQGSFRDFTLVPLVPSMAFLRALKLHSVGAVYWRGVASEQSLQRVQGLCFANREELDTHLHLREEAERRDHRKLGKELELFTFFEDAPGMPFYLPNGLVLRNLIENYERALQKNHYLEVRTPVMMHERLWQTSGHIDHYYDNMYFLQDKDQQVVIKPMSCPGHMLLFKSKMRSYRDLPLRLSEYGLCHRRELSGTLSGLMRVRAFTQDDAHIFVAPDQIENEIADIIKMVNQVYQTLGFNYHVELSTRPVNALGNDALWELAEQDLANVLEKLQIPYQVNAGDGAFYGPKIDIHIEDALKRRWQCGTIQLDFQLPERFDLSYIDESGAKQRPIVIHRAIFGSIERFLGILIEHFGGLFPLWLAPIQIGIIPVKAGHMSSSLALKEELEREGFRVVVDGSSEKLSYKIRSLSKQKVPLTLVLGDQEVEQGTISVRRMGQKQPIQCELKQFIEEIICEVTEKRSAFI